MLPKDYPVFRVIDYLQKEAVHPLLASVNTGMKVLAIFKCDTGSYSPDESRPNFPDHPTAGYFEFERTIVLLWDY